MWKINVVFAIFFSAHLLRIGTTGFSGGTYGKYVPNGRQQETNLIPTIAGNLCGTAALDSIICEPIVSSKSMWRFVGFCLRFFF
jgi:hypothetical protein